MIKANELRIGNIVRWSGHIVTINTASDIDLISPSGHPIELAPEWLERSGFENGWYQFDNGQTMQYSSGELSLMGWDSATSNQSFITKIEYLHQLQNLYFALTGEELQIKMP